MLTIAIPADWSPETAFRHLDLASLVIQVDPSGLISWYEIGLSSYGPDPRYNLAKPFGLRGLKPCPTGPSSPTESSLALSSR
jgi:hypothetical protein